MLEEKSLAACNPELLKEWDYTRNESIGLFPENITYGSNKKAYWICSKDSRHFWETTIKNRAVKGNNCPICSNKQIVFGINDLYTCYPEISQEWDYDKNSELGLCPKKLGAGSGKSVFWKCVNGHSWKTRINHRVCSSTGCPHCYRNPYYDGNDFASNFPELLKEWDYEKNDKLGIFPDKIAKASRKIVYWKCVNNHEWKTRISERYSGYGCKECHMNSYYSNGNDFLSNNPELMKEWDYDKNNNMNIFPDKVTKKSEKIVHWKCEFSHEWTMSIYSRVKNNDNNCPLCSKDLIIGVNDLITQHNDVLNYWDYEQNNKRGIIPDHLTKNSRIKVYWKCQDGHSSYLSPYQKIVKNTSCHYCSKHKYHNGNDFATNHPELLKEWDYKRNNQIGLKPDKVSRGSEKKAYWIGECKHTWKAKIVSRTYKESGCPQCCNQESKIEKTIKNKLKLRSGNIRTIKNCYTNSNLAKCDIVDNAHKIIIEYDGYYWHKDKMMMDAKKTTALIHTGYKVIRIREKGLPSLKDNIMNNDYYEVDNVYPYGANKNSEIENIIDSINTIKKNTIKEN